MNRDQRGRRRAGQLQGAIRLECLDTSIVECRYCKTWLPEKLWTVDHVIPKSRGGPKRAVANLVIAACHECNNKKASYVPCPACGSIRCHRTYDRITWSEIAYCAGCEALVFAVTRPRPGTAPPHLKYGRTYRATGRVVAFQGRV